jgi:hypothetical protein
VGDPLETGQRGLKINRCNLTDFSLFLDTIAMFTLLTFIILPIRSHQPDNKKIKVARSESKGEDASE